MAVAVSARTLECCGGAFLGALALQQRGFPRERGGLGEGEAFGASRPEDDEKRFDDDVSYLRSLDPKLWRDQDHYAVLGVKRLRHEATDDDIRRAYRFKVLRHHPDKRKAQGEDVRPDDDYFTCITKAYEILGSSVKRRSYDSVDSYVDDSLPEGDPQFLKANFFDLFPACFERNARWSERKNPPLLGDMESSREHVERFYNFWYEFDSWREYSYLDEEEKEKGQDRDERRWIEKQNRAARAKRKKEEMSRIRQLVDLAYDNDPRIVKFKNEERDKKLALKQARKDAALARKADEERLANEAKLAKEAAEKEERAREESLKTQREALKKRSKKERKTFRDLCKSNDYYATDERETVDHMAAVEKICEVFELEELERLNNRVRDEGRQAFVEAMNETETRLEAERRAQLASQKSDEKTVTGGTLEWSQESIESLIKAVNFFPAGTNQRWEAIANFVNRHAGSRTFTAKDVLDKAKRLQSSDFSKSSLKVAADREAFDKFEKEKKRPVAPIVDDAGISKCFDEKLSLQNGHRENDAPWNKTEQELLEQAIKTYPVNTPERWDRIAECVPSRNKRDCMKRYKELVNLVKAKKAAAVRN